MKFVTHLLLCSFFLISISACKKTSNDFVGTKQDSKGTVTLTVNVFHHTVPIQNIKVYLKTGADQYPGNDVSKYDFTAVSDANGVAQFSALPYGNIWVYGTGYDPNVKRGVVGNTGIVMNQAYVGSDNKADLTLYVSE